MILCDPIYLALSRYLVNAEIPRGEPTGWWVSAKTSTLDF